MVWTLTDAAQTFQAHQPLWDELNAAASNHILLDSRFVQLLLQHLGERQILLARDNSTSSPAMLLLFQQRQGAWSTYQPSQQPIGNLLFSNPARVEQQVGELLRHLPGYPLLLGLMQQDPDHSCMPRTDTSLQVEPVAYIETGRISLKHDFDLYWQSRPDELRDGNARRRRRLEREGTQVQLRVLREPHNMEQGLRHYCHMETEGWKGAVGTAVNMADPQGNFYVSMLQALSASGEAVIYELLFNDKPVASQLCILRGRMLVSLKIAFDIEYRRDAPGFLLQEAIIRHLHQERGVEVIEFYGRVTDGWTLKWTDEIRSMFHLNFYRNSVIRKGFNWVRPLRQAGARFGMVGA
jgi:CelD/BcsL family acetyltransferase involved in cellulose biosynthesis